MAVQMAAVMALKLVGPWAVGTVGLLDGEKVVT